MPLPVIEDVMRVVFHWVNSNGGYAINVMHYWDAALTGSEADLRTALNANWQNAQQETMSEASETDYMTIQKLDGNSAAVPLTRVGNSVGQNGFEPMPNCATVVSLRTAQGGPRGRGRIFLPFTDESQSANGFLEASSVTTQTEAWNDFQEAMTLDGFPLVVASYEHLDFHQVTACIVKPWVGTQKRRLNRLKT